MEEKANLETYSQINWSGEICLTEEGVIYVLINFNLIEQPS